MPHLLRWAVSILSLGLLSSCFPVGNPNAPIPTATIPAHALAERLVVVLPGRGDDLPSLRKRELAKIIQQAWPGSDVELTGLTMGYYRAGNATQRLHDEVIAPARTRGYKQVWLLGISLGGMGAVLYDRQYPDDVDGIVLLSPYLGDETIHRQIRAAGGLKLWDAPPAEPITADNFQQQLWRHLHEWSEHPGKAARVWLAFGERDRLRPGIDLMVPILPSDHVLVLPGGHNWTVWKPSARRLLEGIAKDAKATAGERGNAG